MKKIMFLFVFITLLFLSCEENDNPEESRLDEFVSLNAEKDTILTGQSTKICAVVEGKDVSFSWSATAGDILGYGSEITYAAPPCTPGKNTIKCTASASNKSESKTIIITVF